MIAATLTTISFLPQAIQTGKTKDTKSISLPMYVAFATGAFLWFVYGIFTNSIPLIIANGITFLLASFILFLKVKYK